MAKICMVNRDKLRAQLSAKAKVIRESLKKVIKDPDVEYDEKMTAIDKLTKRSRDESPCRHRRRCQCCGRPRGVLRKFKMCRICLRNAAMLGNVPGIVKSSW
jgi:small subunit ribosomal protein S14